MASKTKNESSQKSASKPENNLSFQELEQNTELLNLTNIDLNNIVLGPLFTGTMGSLTFSNIPIYYKNPNGKLSFLVFPIEKCFTFGIQANTLSGAEKGGFPYQLSFVLYSKDGATDKEKAIYENMNKVFEKIAILFKEFKIDDSVKGSKDMKKHQQNPMSLNDMHTSALKEPSGKQLTPILNAKLQDKNVKDPKDKTKYTKQISTPVYIKGNEKEIDPTTLVGKLAHCVPIIFIEKISMTVKGPKVQVKVWEVEMDLISSGNQRKRFLSSTSNSSDQTIVKNPLLSNKNKEEEKEHEEEVEITEDV